MNKKILISLSIIGLIITVVVGGTWAYYFDRVTSTGNTFAYGELKLTLNETDGAPINLTNMQPGDIASGSMIVENIGSLVGWLGARSFYVEADNNATAPNGEGPNMSADNTAKMLLITAFTADTVNILAAIPDSDGDGRITIYDMVSDSSAIAPPHAGGLWYSYDINMEPAEVHIYSLTVQFDTAANNDYQGDGIIWTFEFLLDQQ